MNHSVDKNVGKPAIQLMLCLGALVCGTVARADLPKASEKATILVYDVDASLIFVDALGRPRTGAFDLLGADAPAPREAAPARALGLGRFRIAATWQAMDSASLSAVFRPDAPGRGAEEPGDGEPREMDTRAGDVFSGSPYRLMPRIRLLDAYQLTIAPGSALSAGFGVFEDLSPPSVSYPQLLAFGLETRLPGKFSGARLIWRRDRASATGEAQATPDGVSVELTIFQGDGDRAETSCELSADASRPCGASSKSNDRAPTARDPYQGAALGTNWTRGSFGFGIMGGTYDEADMGGRKSEVFGKVDGRYRGRLLARDLRVSLDLRYARERWRGDVSVRPRVQRSQQLTVAYEMARAASVLLGLSLGQSDQDPQTAARPLTEHVPVSGYQIEVGYLAMLGKGLSVQLMLSHERRIVTDAEGAQRGAIYGHEDDKRTLRRMGLGLTYELNDNA